MTWVIDSGVYYSAAKKCRMLAGDICLALGPLLHTLTHECGGMAGDHETSNSWTSTYDKHAADIVTLAATLANALQRFGDVLAAKATTGGTPTAPKPAAPNPSAPPPPSIRHGTAHHASPYGPVVPSGIGSLSCRVLTRIDLNGDHGITVGEVEQVWFNREYLTAEGRPKATTHPLMQQTGNLFTTSAEPMVAANYF